MDAHEAARWRASQPRSLSPLKVAGVQLLAGVAVVLVCGVLFQINSAQVKSAAYGVLAAWLPAVFFARLVARRMRARASAGGALMALLVGEGVKITLTVALLFAAPKVLTQVHWLALLAGFVVTIKAAWVALWWMSVKARPAARPT